MSKIYVVVTSEGEKNCSRICRFVRFYDITLASTFQPVLHLGYGREVSEKSVQLEGGHPVQSICAASFKIRRIMLRGKGVLIINSGIRRKQTMI